MAIPVSGGSGCGKAFGITLLVFSVLGLGLFALVAGFGVWSSNQPIDPGAKASARTQPEDPKVTNRRLFLEEHRWDDNAREFIFRGALRKGGERCDSVEISLMTRRGTWTVRCPPGHVFVFKFDEDGELVSATKLR